MTIASLVPAGRVDDATPAYRSPMIADDPDVADGSDLEAGAAAAPRLSDRFTLALSLLPGTAFMLFFVWRSGSNPYGPRRFTLFDDAMISMTYARTLANTGEFVWFPGAPRVQGITNPLWTLYMSVLHLVGLEGSGAALAVSLTGVVLILVSAVLVFLLVRRGLGVTPRTRAFWLLAAASIPFLYPLTFWTLRGMEVGLIAVLILTIVWAAPLASNEGASSGKLVVAGAAGALGVLTRLDFAILVVVVLAWCMWWATDRRARVRLALSIGIPVGLALSAVLLFQRLYWGDWLPNTYRLKVEGFSAQERVYRGMVTYGKVLPLFALVLLELILTMRLDRGVARRIALVLTSVFAAGSAYSIWVGGDAWEWFRFVNRYVSTVLPAAVVVVLLAVGLLLRDAALPTIRWSVVALVLVPLAAIGAGLSSNPYNFEKLFALHIALLMLLAVGALAIALNWKRWRPNVKFAGPLIAAATAGALLASTSYPLYNWLSDGGPHVADDQRVTEQALALHAATQDHAVIATVWAGAPAYHSTRTMIDLLGKSDRVIATTPPKGDLYPGHNKWNYDYSIGSLRPDVVFQLWASPPSSERMAEWGYVQQCLNLPGTDEVPVYFLASSTQVIWENLHACPTSPP